MWYWDTMLSTQGQCQGCPFWCFNDQTEATWRGSHAKQKRNLAFSVGNMDQMAWKFHGRILTPWPTISTRIHSPGPPAPCRSTQKPCVQVERLLGSVKLEKESDYVTIWHVNKMRWRQSGGTSRPWYTTECWFFVSFQADFQVHVMWWPFTNSRCHPVSNWIELNRTACLLTHGPRRASVWRCRIW